LANSIFDVTYFIETNFHFLYFYSVQAKYSVFEGCLFSGPANFSKSSFEKLRFGGLVLNDRVINLVFKAPVDFSGCRFQNTQFDRTIFANTVTFSQSSFEDTSFTLTSFLDWTNFNFVQFTNGEKVRLDVKDLTKVSFRNSDITKVRFSQYAGWGRTDKFKVLDEEILDKAGDISLGSVITIYRNLQKNYDHYFRFEEADRFYVREMEVRRKYKEQVKKGVVEVRKKCWIFRNILSFLGWYRIVSNYRLSYTRPMLIIIGILSILFGYPLVTGEFSTSNLANFFNIPESQVRERIFYLVIAFLIVLLLIPAIKNAFQRRLR
jgi:uncharacterized protein YjbI with pentapeptide repeats